MSRDCSQQAIERSGSWSWYNHLWTEGNLGPPKAARLASWQSEFWSVLPLEGGGMVDQAFRRLMGKNWRIILTGTLVVQSFVPWENGEAWAGANTELEVSPSRGVVGRFEKIEFVIEGVPEPSHHAEESRLYLEVMLPSGNRVQVPAFWYQPYERRTFPGQRQRTDWFYPIGEPRWLARFAPWELGVHQAKVRWEKSAVGTVDSPLVQFECTPSQRRGFLRQSRKAPRFFETSDGKPFFAIGQNLAFIGGGQYFNLARVEETLPRLAALGVNFLRVWTCCEDWALCIEGRKSAWTRTWYWKLPVEEVSEGEAGGPPRRCVVLAGKAGDRLALDPSWPVALRPDTDYLFSGKVRTENGTRVVLELPGRQPVEISRPQNPNKWTEFHIPFRSGPGQWWLGTPVFRLLTEGKAWVDALSLREVRPDGSKGPELLWEADVNRPARGFYNPVDCVLLDHLIELAESHGIYLQLCMLTRDLYMWALKDPGSPEYDAAIADAKRFFRYAIARWGYSTAVGAWEYWNEMDPGLPTERFYEELGQFFETHDPYQHLRTTSTWHPSPRDMKHPRLDIADTHFYLRPSEKRLRDEVEAVLDRARFLREHAPTKPALLSEFGLATEKWGLSDDMKSDRQAVHFHHALWASALSGLSGTAMFWWWEQLDQLGAYRHYGPVARFVASIPWDSGELLSLEQQLAGGNIRLVGLRTRSAAWCWLVHRQATWVGAGSRGVSPEPVPAGEFFLEGLVQGNYRIEWWDPWEGKVLGGEGGVIKTTEGKLRVKYPPFRSDLACQITRED
jgi:hypothetical protein